MFDTATRGEMVEGLHDVRNPNMPLIIDHLETSQMSDAYIKRESMESTV